MDDICDVCGNECPASLNQCPFCKSPRVPKQEKKKTFYVREVNLETGRPVVDVALNRMRVAVQDSSARGFAVLILIHGYGSSGTGGAIRTECRKMLDFMVARKDISGFLPGESFSKNHGPVRPWIQRYPELAANKHINRKNRGITVVFL